MFNAPRVEGYGNTFKNGKLAFQWEEVPYYSKTWADNLHPATKEQRDLLFQKMKDAGYELDAEKKELKKIMDKSSWSEQDERNLKGVIDEIEANKNSAPDCDLATHNRFLSCLKSLRHRIGI